MAIRKNGKYPQKIYECLILFCHFFRIFCKLQGINKFLNITIQYILQIIKC